MRNELSLFQDNLCYCLTHDYGLTLHEAFQAIEESGILEYYSSNPEMASHDPIEVSAEIAFIYWRNHNK